MAEDPAYKMLAYLTVDDLCQLKDTEKDILVSQSLAQPKYSAEITSSEGLLEAYAKHSPFPYQLIIKAEGQAPPDTTE